MTGISFTLPIIGTVVFDKLVLPAILLGGAIDSINPCAFGVLIFLIAYLSKVFESKKMVLLGGLLYTASVYVTYFLAGLGLLSAVQSQQASYWFYWVATIVAFSAAVFELKDFFWYGRGVSMDMNIIPGAAERIKVWTEKIKTTSQKSPKMALALTIPIGFGAAAFELPCTGQVYLAILSLIKASQVAIGTWLPWLLLYNLVFVAPLIIITFVMYFGMSSEKLEAWRQKNRRHMRLMAGLFLYALGGFLLWFTFNQFPDQPTLGPMGFVLFATQVIFISYVLYKGYFGKNGKTHEEKTKEPKNGRAEGQKGIETEVASSATHRRGGNKETDERESERDEERKDVETKKPKSQNKKGRGNERDEKQNHGG